MTSGFSLPTQARLRHARDFAALRESRGHIRGQFFLLRYGQSFGDGPRMAMAVSRRVSVRATERNRIKRHIRESFRHRRSQLPPVDVLVVAHRCASHQNGAVLRADLDRLWTKLARLGAAVPRPYNARNQRAAQSAPSRP